MERGLKTLSKKMMPFSCGGNGGIVGKRRKQV